jgi:hypothetical protein
VGFGAGHDSDLAFVAVLRAVEGAEELIMLRTVVLTVFMAAWLATGIAAGIVMGRRRRTTTSPGGCWALRSAR